MSETICDKCARVFDKADLLRYGSLNGVGRICRPCLCVVNPYVRLSIAGVRDVAEAATHEEGE
jgi:hypothetical protein